MGRPSLEVARFEEIDFSEVYADVADLRGTISRPFTIINMVSTFDGKAALATKAGKLGTATDRLLMRKIRSACDAVMYGVGTLRFENVDPTVPDTMVEARQLRGQPAQPLRVVISASGNVPLENLFFRVQGDQPVVFTTTAAGECALAALRRASRVIVTGESIDLQRVAGVLAGELGVRNVVVEGGPALSYSMIQAGLVDEVFLTLAARIVGGQPALTIIEGPELSAPALVGLALVSVYRGGSELFLRYRVTNGRSDRDVDRRADHPLLGETN